MGDRVSEWVSGGWSSDGFLMHKKKCALSTVTRVQVEVNV